jgi:hypothetical protein
MTDAMTVATKYWDGFSVYMEYMENALGINLDNLGPIIPLIKSPVLVVGAGQGLLVEELRKRGFAAEGIDMSPQMVAGAEKRRGIKLFLGNANHMPFKKGQFKTTIVATGVLDFLEDRGQIEAIMAEARRVTDEPGEIFATLFGMTPQMEELSRYVGALSENRFDQRIYNQLMWGPKGPLKEAIALITKDPRKSIPGLVFRLIKAGRSSERNKTRRDRIRELRKLIKAGKIESPRSLRDYLPGYLFIRSDKEIEELLTDVSFPPKRVYVFDNCKIARSEMNGICAH